MMSYNILKTRRVKVHYVRTLFSRHRKETFELIKVILFKGTQMQRNAESAVVFFKKSFLKSVLFSWFLVQTLKNRCQMTSHKTTHRLSPSTCKRLKNR